jgi:predicted transcriptional regulator
MTASLMPGIEIDNETQARLLRLAEQRSRTPAGLMQDAIAQYIHREEARERMVGDALAAWHAYQADGRHVSEAEADAWLAALEAGNDCPPPECHD